MWSLAQLEMVDWIGSVGFPIAVASYLLIRVEARLERLAAAFDRLSDAITARKDRP